MLCRLPRALGTSRPRAHASPRSRRIDCLSKRSQYRPIISTEPRSVSNLSRSTFFDDRPVRSFVTSPRLLSSDEDSSRPFPPIPSPPPSSNPNTTNSQSNTTIPLATIITGPLKPFDDKPKRDKSLPPEKPKPDECCSEYCVNCVWLQYIDELFEYLGPRIATTDIEELIGTFDADEGVKAYILLEAKMRKKKYAEESSEDKTSI